MKKSIMAIVTVMMMLTVAFIPVVAASHSDAEETINPPNVRDVLIEAGYSLYEVDGVEYVEIGDVEYELAFLLAGFALGFAFGTMFGKYILGSGDTSGITQEDVFRALRQGEVGKVIAVFDTAKNMAAAVLHADAELWKFTTNYWQRAAEYYVAEFWSETGSLDLDNMLDGIDLYDNIAHYIHDWSEAIDVAYNAYTKYPGTTDGWNKQGLDSIPILIKWNGGSISSGNPSDPAYSLWSDMCQYLQSSGGRNTAYIYNGPHPAGSSSEYANKIYYFGSGTATITNLDTGNQYRLNAGSNSLNSIYSESSHASNALPSGTYIFENGKQFAGPIIPSANDSGADLSGVLIFGHGSTTYYATSDMTDSVNSVRVYNSNGTVASNSSFLKYEISYIGKDGATFTEESAIYGPDNGNNGVHYDLIGNYNELIRSIEFVVSEVCEDAKAAWSIFDIMEEANSAISPSIIRTTAEDIPMSAAEYVATYIQMMIQIHDAYQRNMDAIDNGQVNINPESLALYVYGDIWKNGSLWAKNVVFTPYINNTNQSLAVGDNRWAGTGHAMIWWQGDNLSQWTGSASLSKYTYVALDKNTEIKVKQIIKNHVNVSSINLTKSNIIEYVPGSDVPVPSPDAPTARESNIAKTLMMIVFILLAILALLVIGYVLGMWIPAFIIAAILLAIGLLFPGTLVDIATGNFHFSLWGSLF